MLYRVILTIFAVSTLCSCNHVQAGYEATEVNNEPILSLEGDTLQRVELSAAEWKIKLSPFAFKVLREAGTERSFTGKYWNNKEKGIYLCGGCEAPMFESSTKFRSGTGWPSFTEPIFAGNVVEKSDNSYGMTRVEVLCARCDGHLGHVFPDGPEPTGLRYCINSVSLKFLGEETKE